MRSTLILGLSVALAATAQAAPTTVDMPIDMSFSNGRFCVSIATQCTDGWSFWQHKSGAHVPGGGIGGANDTYAWDVNLNSPYADFDAGKPVYAVEAGTIYTGNGWGGNTYGQLLINHSTAAGNWSSGYLHMTSIVKKSGTVKKGDIIGYISRVGANNNHLHFAVYNGWNAAPTSINVSFTGKTAVADAAPPAPTLIAPANGATNLPPAGVNFSWYASGGATSYRIVISQNSNFAGFVDTGTGGTCDGTCYTLNVGNVTSFSKAMSLKNYTYYWKVRAAGPGGTSGWSTTRSFKTAAN